MTRESVDVNGLYQAIQEAIEIYGDDIAEDIKDEVKAVAKECAAEIRQNAQQLFNGKDYAKSWKTKVTEEKPTSIKVTVYSSKYYGLAHLLEHGHNIVKNKKVVGRVQGRAHIRPAEQHAEEKLINKAKARVTRE